MLPPDGDELRLWADQMARAFTDRGVTFDPRARRPGLVNQARY